MIKFLQGRVVYNPSCEFPAVYVCQNYGNWKWVGKVIAIIKGRSFLGPRCICNPQNSVFIVQAVTCVLSVSNEFWHTNINMVSIGLAPTYLYDELNRPADTEAGGRLRSASSMTERSTYSSVHCRSQSISCRSQSTVEQSSIAYHCWLLSLQLPLSS